MSDDGREVIRACPLTALSSEGFAIVTALLMVEPSDKEKADGGGIRGRRVPRTAAGISVEPRAALGRSCVSSRARAVCRARDSRAGSSA